MNVIMLPVEIYNREFDAKLLLATRLAADYNKTILIGYDKHFIGLSRLIQKGILLDKSCSSIVHAGRIKNVKEKKGKVIISDEEGFNNLHLIEKTYYDRISQEAIADIDA